MLEANNELLNIEKIIDHHIIEDQKIDKFITKVNLNIFLC